jgi:hypothetical protein
MQRHKTQSIRSIQPPKVFDLFDAKIALSIVQNDVLRQRNWPNTIRHSICDPDTFCLTLPVPRRSHPYLMPPSTKTGMRIPSATVKAIVQTDERQIALRCQAWNQRLKENFAE